MSISPFSLTLQETPYIERNVKVLNDRVICKYLLDNSEESVLDRAVIAIEYLLRQHTNLIPTFSTDREMLKAAVGQNNYLIINGRAVSIAPQEEGHVRAQRNLLDKLFSENLLEEPVKCGCGNYFEKRRLEFWKQRVDSRCPFREDHPLPDPLVVDDEIVEDIRRFHAHNEQSEQFEETIRAKQAAQRMENANLREVVNHQGRQLANVSGVDPVTVGGGITKIVFKAGAKEGTYIVCKQFAKQLTKEGTKASGKNLAKNVTKYAIPGVSLIIGISLGIYRVTQGQYKMAVAEVASGGAACIPGVGTGISIAIDVGITGCDLYEPVKVWYNQDGTVEAELDLNHYYGVIGINIRDYPNPRKDQVDAAYRQNARYIHPDTGVALGDYNREQLEELTQLLNTARDTIYRLRGW